MEDLSTTYTKFRELARCFAKHINLICDPAESSHIPSYLCQHLSGDIPHYWVTYRDSENNWYSKSYVLTLDDEAKHTLGVTSRGTFLITNTNQEDCYLNYLLHSCREDAPKDEPYNKEKDSLLLDEKVRKWKELLPQIYNRSNHIRSFVLDFFQSFELKDRNGDVISTLVNILCEYLPEAKDVNYLEFTNGAFICEFTDIALFQVRLKSMTGFFGEVHSYLTPPKPNYGKTIIIPEFISCFGAAECKVMEICNNCFDNLLDAEQIRIPSSVCKIEWGFWNCKRLKDIYSESYTYPSRSGVLFKRLRHGSNDVALIAYPNAKSPEYEVPVGTIEIAKFAFKDCDNLRTLRIPNSVKKIGVNAFYRCTKLKDIYCDCREEDLKFEGYCGEFGDVNPSWHYQD